ncbi:uncharacterized protein si:dkey-225f5.4 isoform X2 [Dunckerocampus dactyliophorus]|uniref:uncharacterized protein si:dkey-225f5.4 isoform X2 n=1 Tax=Dunckerocampus dactyliophorus TaxID=161453 RepID=UPI0024055113|nr:uncharacterized protein si:dkey-225f5.4 isoform X2 [Dunckerocampus dactyliophorus]
MTEIQTVLQHCDPVLLVPCAKGDESDSAGGTLLFLQDSRQVRKVLWRQLFVLDSMMHLLEGLPSAGQLLTQPCPPPPDGAARGRWKAAKAESRSRADHTEALLTMLHHNIQNIVRRRHRVAQLLQQLHAKQSEDVETSLQRAHSVLRACDGQLTQLRVELGAVLECVDGWRCSRDDLKAYASAVHDVMHLLLLSFNQSEVSLERAPHPPNHRNQSTNEPEPLKVLVTWSHDDSFRLQVNKPGLVPHCISGRRSELSAALLEATQYYMGQADLLSEIHRLRSSFAIDWLPARRLLVYLKSASLVCHLHVQEGYPNSGAVRLLSVHRDGHQMETSGLQALKPDSRVTDWLLLLCSSPLI